MADLRLVVVGAGGRMGRALIRAIEEADGVTLAGALERPGSPALGRDAGVLAGLPALGVPVLDDPQAAFEGADGVLDFTAPESSVLHAGLAADAGLFHVIGTTGLSAEDEAALAAAAERTVLVKSGNMSLGVNLLAALVKRAAATLGPDFDIEIVEMHHRMKVDAPSGTALLLGRAAAEGRGVDLDERAVRGRDGITGARHAGDIGFAALRGGTVVGDHDVIFAGTSERLVLGHKAEDRMIFARGALRAAQWARGKAPGLYSMADVLGLKDF
ncbi:4-hydroxy-tetrahydrodipicolinate reductase [Blastochloris sulfoviridis]|uniref:4-hydroxy-tetrahydrodipicolinate reductase n=1 Tax=Blastochloris sulfoviridis TaxID=50712 RepID=A0A5M6I576_9HYPH|nr:4-hydroxy-tetrahydrodipicolinate reductase [Blastochloris sulfoviridis]KAA5602949.1 4-hydroxy-tetrahydrodipicolinate reductase [Blastochloris sulfoviridis]